MTSVGGVRSPSNGKITVLAGNKPAPPDVNIVYMMKQMTILSPLFRKLLISFTFLKLVFASPMRDNIL